MPTSIQYKGMRIWKKYYASFEGNKDEEFFKKMDEKYEEVEEIVKKLNDLKEELQAKQDEMREIAEDANLGYGDIEMTHEDSFFGSDGDIYINDEKLKMKTAEKRDFWEGKDRRGFETYDDKTNEEYEKDTNWYITFEYWDEGWFELEVEDDEFDKSKLKWNGESLSYGDEYGFDDIGSKPSENMYAMHFPKIDRFFRLNTLETWN